jgi:hypothetical protein
VVLFCEAKNFREHAGEAKHAAAEALSDELGVPYVVELGWMKRGPMPPAIFYDPTVLVLRRWWQQDDPGAFDDQRNVATFAIRDGGATAAGRTEFLAFVHHLEPLSGDVRLEQARRVSRYGDAQPRPVIRFHVLVWRSPLLPQAHAGWRADDDRAGDVQLVGDLVGVLAGAATLGGGVGDRGVLPDVDVLGAGGPRGCGRWCGRGDSGSRGCGRAEPGRWRGSVTRCWSADGWRLRCLPAHHRGPRRGARRDRRRRGTSAGLNSTAYRWGSDP